MELIVFDNQNGSIIENVQELVRGRVEITGAMFFRTFGGFINQLHTFYDGVRIVIIISPELALLEELTLGDWLSDKDQLVLVLEDRSIKTVAAGHNLTPRCMTCVDDDVDVLLRTLDIMISKPAA